MKLCVLTLLWSLVGRLLALGFHSVSSITQQRFAVDGESSKLGSDGGAEAQKEPLLDDDGGGSDRKRLRSGFEASCSDDAGEETETERSVLKFVESKCEFQPSRDVAVVLDPSMSFSVGRCVDYQFLKFEFPAIILESMVVSELTAKTEQPASSPLLEETEQSVSTHFHKETEHSSAEAAENTQFQPKLDDDDTVVRLPDDLSDDDYIELDLQGRKPVKPVTLTGSIGWKVPQEREGSGSGSEDEYEFDVIKQHQDLIQQMKMELKQAKSGPALPTIFEDSESPKIADDLRPLTLSKKLEHQDVIHHVHRFYKGYADRMRKLDVLNHQTLDALSLIRLKEATRGEVAAKAERRSALSSVFGGSKTRSRRAGVSLDEANLGAKFELIYVGQLCLSWEMLNWQHGRAVELLELDPDARRRYNQVADEFQQFQVMLQRFVENEAFQGSGRVRRYAERRAAFRGLLHVPLIRDDYLKDKKARKEEGCEGAITISALVRIIDEARRVFYEFLRADKRKGVKVDPQRNGNQDLFIEAHTKLHKKEKRLKELARSKGCLAKKIRNVKEPRLEQAMFLARVELRLVARVLSMSEISRDHLVWCHRKLDEINIVDRRLHLEPTTFLLFPC
uniref:Uncharacterized protein n=1 Tax=Kalanchoe fedtschenkoi TaxID=63787 RepID=A0A7N0ZVY6_KALFE